MQTSKNIFIYTDESEDLKNIIQEREFFLRDLIFKKTLFEKLQYLNFIFKRGKCPEWHPLNIIALWSLFPKHLTCPKNMKTRGVKKTYFFSECFLTSDTIDILCLVYLIFLHENIMSNVHKHTFIEFKLFCRVYYLND